jgi:hypothetical protein
MLVIAKVRLFVVSFPELKVDSEEPASNLDHV